MDSQTFYHIKDGDCQPYCTEDKENKSCNFTAKYSIQKLDNGVHNTLKTPETKFNMPKFWVYEGWSMSSESKV